ncbi:Lipase 2 [Pontiella desulfatans]|uniref:Lipase 2 n=1 Tax=Pontiella desulfatans TaxID=2750659 RepID=A0A6C2U7Y9_PONDE|nr:alpha/beta hydrolase fold domain-containing protein [Pontiella desulfatans]VGO16065.1 Lipase 2 [Pontiella desulfatans]
MKTRYLIAAWMFCLSAYPQQRGNFTYDRIAERHDKNGDGIVAKDEFGGNPLMFDRIDANQDRKIDRKEFDAAIRARSNQQRPAIAGIDGNTAPLPRKQVRSRQPPEGVTLHRDLEYAVEEGQSLKLDLYLPEKTDTPPPLMVWIHGGGWKNGDKANVNGAILKLSSEGYAVASINYRLKDLSIHPKNIHDCKGAVRWLRAHAKEFGFDPEQVAVGGGSAGGHLSLLLGLSHGFAELEGTVGGNLDHCSAVKAIIDLYGPSDFSSFSKNSERFNKAHEFRMEQLKHASPTTYLTKNDPPVLILHGDQDKTVPVEQSILLDKRYKELGLESELHILEGAGHGGVVFSDDERFKLIKAFLDRHLK